MNKHMILVLAIVFSSMALASANSVCNNALCEKPINVGLGKDFTISLKSYTGTGSNWWMQFDTQYLSLGNSTIVPGKASFGMVGVPGKENFTFNTKKIGTTEVTMLLLRPWVNGTIGDRKIFPVNIM
jgi:predicted secreted protein